MVKEFRNVSEELGYSSRKEIWDRSDSRAIRVPDSMRNDVTNNSYSYRAAIKALRYLDKMRADLRAEFLNTLVRIQAEGKSGEWVCTPRRRPLERMVRLEILEENPEVKMAFDQSLEKMIRLGNKKMEAPDLKIFNDYEKEALVACTLAGDKLLEIYARDMQNTSPSKLKEA